MPTPVPAAPTAVPARPDRTDRPTFSARCVNIFEYVGGAMWTEITAYIANAYANAVDALASANASAVSAAASLASKVASDANAALAALYAGATVWVSGTTYAIGNMRYSPANGRVYRRLTAGAGTTDPASDTTNWSPVNVEAPAQIVTALVHQAISGQCLALANTTAQAAATNLLLYSEQFDRADWLKFGSAQDVGITVTANVGVAPDGTTTADQVVVTSTAAGVSLRQNVSSISGAHCFSVFVRQTAGAAGSWTIDIGDAYSSAGTFTGGWQGIFSSGVVTAAVFCDIALNVVGGSGTFEVWGAQLEVGSSRTSYIPTVASQVTRPAGVIAPQRIVLPAAPVANDYVRVVIANGIATNVIANNGFSIETSAANDVMTLDKTLGAVDLQFINSVWRIL